MTKGKKKGGTGLERKPQKNDGEKREMQRQALVRGIKIVGQRLSKGKKVKMLKDALVNFKGQANEF